MIQLPGLTINLEIECHPEHSIGIRHDREVWGESVRGLHEMRTESVNAGRNSRGSSTGFVVIYLG